MSKSLLLNPEYDLYDHSGVAMCDSLQVAELFKKRHDNVLGAIREAVGTLEEASKDTENPDTAQTTGEFNRLNFKEIGYKDARGRKQPKFLMTRAGFNYIATAFTGKEAAIYKVMLMNRFEAMESHLSTRQTARLEYPALTDAIKEAHDDPQSYHYSNESDMINQIVTGKRARELREEYGLAKGESVRDYLSAFELAAIEELQRVSVGLHVAGMDYQQRKEIMAAHYHNKILRRLAA